MNREALSEKLESDARRDYVQLQNIGAMSDRRLEPPDAHSDSCQCPDCLVYNAKQDQWHLVQESKTMPLGDLGKFLSKKWLTPCDDFSDILHGVLSDYCGKCRHDLGEHPCPNCLKLWSDHNNGECPR